MLEVIAGYDPKDELTAFSIGRLPSEPYRSFANERTLNGMRIGVIREHMDKKVFNEADVRSHRYHRACHWRSAPAGRHDRRPRTGGSTLSELHRQISPALSQPGVHRTVSQISFRSDANGKPSTDRISQLVDMFFDPSLVPAGTTIRNIGAASNDGLTKYMLNRYLRERGDANIKSIRDLIDKSKYYRDIRPDAGFMDRKAALEEMNSSMTLDLANSFKTGSPISRSCCNAWRKRTSTRWCLRRGTFRLISWVRPSSRRWPAGRIPSGASWDNTAFRHCPCRRVSPRTCLTESAMPRLLVVRASSGPFRQNFRSGSCSSEGRFPSRRSFGSLRRTRRQQNTAFRRRTSARLRSGRKLSLNLTNSHNVSHRKAVMARARGPFRR